MTNICECMSQPYLYTSNIFDLDILNLQQLKAILLNTRRTKRNK